MIISPSIPDKRTFVVHKVIIDMTCCGNPEPITIGITKTIASPQVLPPTVLKIELLKTLNVPTMDTIVITAAQNATLVIKVIAGFVTASQPLMIAEAKIIIQTARLMKVPFLWVTKLQSWSWPLCSWWQMGLGTNMPSPPQFFPGQGTLSVKSFSQIFPPSSPCCIGCIGAMYIYGWSSWCPCFLDHCTQKTPKVTICKSSISSPTFSRLLLR